MGLFDDNTSRKRDEVRIGISEQDEEDSKLKNDVESRIGSRSSSGSGSSSSDVSLKDIHDQNKRIIGLLEEVVKDDHMDSDSISDRRKNNSRVTDRDSRDNKDDQGMRGGMDELL